MSEKSKFTDAPGNMSMPQATVIPVIHYLDAVVAATWLCRAFGFRERLRVGDHRVQLKVGSGAIVIARSDLVESREQLACSSIMVRVSDVDQHCAYARKAGATILAEPESQPYGERQYSAADIAGRTWTFSQSEANIVPSTWGGRLMESGDDAA